MNNKANNTDKLNEENYRNILAILSKDWEDSNGMSLTHDDGGTWVKMSI